MQSQTAALGRKSLEFAGYVGGMGYLFLDACYWALVAPFQQEKMRIRRGPVYSQMARVGFDSLSVVCVVLLFVGIVLAIQMSYILKTFGVTEYVGSVVGVAMFRELGPLLTGVVMAGYIGAAIAAEIGTMSVSEEIEALTASAINPVRFLVVPRLLATSLMVPCVALIATFVGILGGMLVAWGMLNISPSLYIQKVVEPLVFRDVLTGLFKAWIFGILIALIACYEGLKVDSGAEGVGKATTNAVVYSIVFIIVSDCIFTTIFYFMFEA